MQSEVTPRLEINSAYQEPKIKSDDLRLPVMDQDNKVADTKITDPISGKEKSFPKEDKINDWIQFDESNNLVVDQSKVELCQRNSTPNTRPSTKTPI